MVSHVIDQGGVLIVHGSTLERKVGGYFVSDEKLKTGLKVAAFISIGVMVLQTE